MVAEKRIMNEENKINVLLIDVTYVQLNQSTPFLLSPICKRLANDQGKTTGNT